ncbi:hypothetical protein QL285_043825 [Trifolium repens]|nr:hypothetical protein QL285_043825 [Trifolium repens]
MAPAAITLLGPPEIYVKSTTTIVPPTQTTAEIYPVKSTTTIVPPTQTTVTTTADAAPIKRTYADIVKSTTTTVASTRTTVASTRTTAANKKNPFPDSKNKKNHFLHQTMANFNNLSTTPNRNRNPPMGRTENKSPTFLSTGNPCLDFFFHVVPDTPSQTLLHILQLAWSHNPLTTLKLVCNLRGVRGTGKSDREAFYNAALWLYGYHPKTLAANVPSLSNFGYFKDLPEILYRLLQGSLIRKLEKDERNKRKYASKNKHKGSSKSTRFGVRRIIRMQSHNKSNFRGRKTNQLQHYSNNNNNNNKDNNTSWKGTEKDSLVTEATAARARAQKEKAHALKEQKRIALAKKLVQRYTTYPNFKLLHDSISDHFADCLKKDLEFLKSGSTTKISLAAKWCPSIDSSFDRSTLLCERIAKRIFPREEYEGVEEAHYAYRVRDRLRKDVLVPLRKVLELPEVFIGANQWNLIPYNRVASVAMNLYKEKFLKHDKERFEKYLKDVKAGKTKIAAGALLPHEIIWSFWR